MEETDGDRLHTLCFEAISQLRNSVKIKRGDDLALVVHSLRNFESQVTGNEGRLFAKTQVIDVRPVGATDLEHVPKPFTGDERGARAGPFHQRIDDDSRAVDKLLNLAGGDARFCEGVHDAVTE